MRLSSMVKHEFKSWIHIWHTYSMKRNILFIIPSYKKVCKQESSTYLIGREVAWKDHGIWNIWDKYIDNFMNNFSEKYEINLLPYPNPLIMHLSYSK